MATLVHHSLTLSHASAAPTRLGHRLRSLFRAWRSRRRERSTYGRISERDLRDAGVTVWEIERELARPFWRD